MIFRWFGSSCCSKFKWSIPTRFFDVCFGPWELHVHCILHCQSISSVCLGESTFTDLWRTFVKIMGHRLNLHLPTLRLHNFRRMWRLRKRRASLVGWATFSSERPGIKWVHFPIYKHFGRCRGWDPVGESAWQLMWNRCRPQIEAFRHDEQQILGATWEHQSGDWRSRCELLEEHHWLVVWNIFYVSIYWE